MDFEIDVEKFKTHIIEEIEYYLKETKISEAFLSILTGKGILTPQHRDHIRDNIPNERNKADEVYKIMLEVEDADTIKYFLSALDGTGQEKVFDKIIEALKGNPATGMSSFRMFLQYNIKPSCTGS